MNVGTTVTVQMNSTEVVTLGFVTQPLNDQVSKSYSMTNGTAAGLVDLHWELPTVTLAASASVTYTLSALTDLLGRAVAFVKVKALLIDIITRTSGDVLVVGNAALHAWVAIVGGTTQTFQVADTELKVCNEGFAVASGTSDQLKITNSGANSITFRIALAGSSV